MSNALNIGNISLPGDGYPSIFGFKIPVTTGLEGAYLFGDGAGQFSRNYAPGKPNATVIGSPSSGSGYGVFSENGYLDTGISETADMTIITVARDSTGFVDPVPGYVGNNFSIASGGVAIYIGSPTTLRGNAIKNGAVDYVNVSGDPAVFTAQCLRARSAAASSFTNMTSGSTASSANTTGTRTVDSSNKIWIGRLPANTFKGINDQVLTLIYSRAISDAELNQIATWLRSYCASKGISV